MGRATVEEGVLDGHKISEEPASGLGAEKTRGAGEDGSERSRNVSERKGHLDI